MAKDEIAKPSEEETTQSSWSQKLRDVWGDVRDWAVANKKRTAITGGVVLLVMACTLTLWTLLAKQVVEEEIPPSLDLALQAMDEHRYEDATSVIRQLQDQDRLTPQDYGGPMFVLGSIKAHQAADETLLDKRRATYLIAAGYLSEARARGFPEGRADEGIYFLAKSLANSAQFVESLPVLREALSTNPQKANEIHQLLTGVFLGLPTPRLEDALEHNKAYLDDRLLSPRKRTAGVMQQAEILLRLGRHAAAGKLFDSLPPEAVGLAETDILKGRLLMADARAVSLDAQLPNDEREKQANAVYEQAISVLRKAQVQKDQDDSQVSGAMYLIGVCYAEMGDDHVDAALDQLARTRKMHFGTPESVAAGMAEADLLLRLKRYDEAVVAYRRVLNAAGEPSIYRNRWLPLERFREHLLIAQQAIVDAGQYNIASTLFGNFFPVFSKTDVLRLQAQSLKQQGEALLEDEDSENRWEERSDSRVGRRHLRHAGTVFEKLSKRHFTTQYYTDDLWNAADCFFKGRSFSHASRVLREYLRYEMVSRRPQALVRLGKALLALGKLNECISVLEECIELHRQDASTYEARIACSQAYREQGELARAKELLIGNLSDDTLTPKSREWRDSLFEYGNLLHATGEYEAATEKLAEAIERYPEARQTPLARYLVADANRKAARDPLERYRAAQSENDRQKQLQFVRDYLTAAATQYHEVQQALTRASADGELRALDKAILRNSYIMRGAVLFDLREYDAALEVFRNASGQYPSDPIVLEAYVQIANCHRRLNRIIESRGALEQAKVVLRRIPKDADFSLATNLTREEWQRLLDDMSKW